MDEKEFQRECKIDRLLHEASNEQLKRIAETLERLLKISEMSL